MSLFRRSVGPPASLPDETVERYVAAIRASIDPDPLFRRRLRGHVLNRYVATREGISPRSAAREMGRIGRAVLYASFALSLSVTGVMAASQQSVPGDPFYQLKREIEALRVQILPAHLHDELAASALRARIVELDRLAVAGNWDAVARHATAVEEAYSVVLSFGGNAGELLDRLTVAGALLDQLPAQAREVVADVLAGVPGVGPGDNAGTPGHGRDHGVVPAGQGGGPSPHPASTPRPDPAMAQTPMPSPPPRPTNPPQAQEQPTPPAQLPPPAPRTPTPAPPTPPELGSQGSTGGQDREPSVSPRATP